MPVKVTKDQTAEVLKSIRLLTGRQLLIGIPADSARQPDKDDPSPISNAAIGYIMETGAPDRNIPARPHLVPGVESIRPRIIAEMKKMGLAALKGDRAAIDKGYNIIGLLGQNAVRGKITDGPFAPLAPRTLAQRKARGRTGDRPLLDTGQLRAAYTYVIRVKGT